MNANYEKKIYVDSSDDIMMLYEKVQLFAQEQGWDGEATTWAEACEGGDKNILSYTRGFYEANKYMNENHNPFLESHPDGGDVRWNHEPDGDKWGLIDLEDYTTVFGASDTEIKEQDKDLPPIT